MKAKIILHLLMALLLIACEAKPGKKITERLASGLATRVSKVGLESDIRNFKTHTYNVLAANESMITHCRCRLEAERKEGNPYFKKKIAELENKNRELRKKIMEFSTNEKKEWERFKEDFSAELADLGQSHRELRVRNTHPE